MNRFWLLQKVAGNPYHDERGRFTFAPEGVARGGGRLSEARENLARWGKPALNFDAGRDKAAWVTPEGTFVQGEVHSLIAASTDPSKYSHQLGEADRFGKDTGAIRIRWGFHTMVNPGHGEFIAAFYRPPNATQAGALARALNDFFDRAPEGKVTFEAMAGKDKALGHTTFDDPRRTEGAIKRMVTLLTKPRA